jgi:hypothetical protein
LLHQPKGIAILHLPRVQIEYLPVMAMFAKLVIGCTLVLAACASAPSSPAAPVAAAYPDSGPTKEEVKAAIAAWQAVWMTTNDPFKARQFAKTQHVKVFMDPAWSKRLDELTATAWTAQGGGKFYPTICYLRGFQYGTAHHSQCVYDVTMEYAERQ